MISGIFHQGSGLGNQLHRYVATRILALDKGYDFSMVAPELFKGSSFMNLDMGLSSSILDNSRMAIKTFHEKKVVENGIDVRSYDPEFNFLGANTVIDGEFQDSKYFEHRLKEIDEWLKVEPIEVPHDTCVIGFRGGEYYSDSNLGLPPKYYYDAMIKMVTDVNPKMRFEVHTDDAQLAQQFFPKYKVIHDIGINWRSMRYAKYAIIANSSFYILPRLLSKGLTIAPRYWARRNIEVWATPMNYYKQFKYI